MKSEHLPHRIQDAILRHLFRFPEAIHQDTLAQWKEAVSETIIRADRFGHDDLKSAIKGLSVEGIVRLTKTGDTELYSGKEEDDARFFFQGRFKMAATEKGRAYWDRIKTVEKPKTDGVVLRKIMLSD
jgi:hypothetical protein